MTTYKIEFASVDASDRSRSAQDLQQIFVAMAGVESATLHKERSDTQDAGTILSIILAGPALVAAVAALHAWLVRNNQGHVTIVKPDGTKVVVTNAASSDVAGIVEKLKVDL